MAVQSYPTGDRSFVQFARFWRPTGSTTTLWVQEQQPLHGRPRHYVAGRMIRVLRWGNEIYVPVEEGMHIGIGVYNGASNYRAYPTYIEAANIYEGGPEEPNACRPSHMWEVRPYQQFVMDKLVNPNAQRGRPLLIERSGDGFTIGEATFGTQEFRGQIRVYERSQLYTAPQPTRDVNDGYSTRGGPIYRGGNPDVLGPTTRGGDFGGVLGGDELPPISYGNSPVLGGGGVSKGMPENTGRAGIGAGEEVHQNHVHTGALSSNILLQRAQISPSHLFVCIYLKELNTILGYNW